MGCRFSPSVLLLLGGRPRNNGKMSKISTRRVGRVEPASDEMSKIIYLRKDVHSFVPLKASPRRLRLMLQVSNFSRMVRSSSRGSTQLNNDSSNYLAPVCVCVVSDDDKVRDEIRLNGARAPTMAL